MAMPRAGSQTYFMATWQPRWSRQSSAMRQAVGPSYSSSSSSSWSPSYRHAMSQTLSPSRLSGLERTGGDGWGD